MHLFVRGSLVRYLRPRETVQVSMVSLATVLRGIESLGHGTLFLGDKDNEKHLIEIKDVGKDGFVELSISSFRQSGLVDFNKGKVYFRKVIKLDESLNRLDVNRHGERVAGYIPLYDSIVSIIGYVNELGYEPNKIAYSLGGISLGCLYVD